MGNKLIRLLVFVVGMSLVGFGVLRELPYLFAENNPRTGGKPTGVHWTDPPQNRYMLNGTSPDGKQIAIHYEHKSWSVVDEYDYILDIDSGMLTQAVPDWVETEDNDSISIVDPYQLSHFPELEVMLTTPFGVSRRLYPPIRLESLDCPSQLIKDQFGTVTATFSNSALVEQTFEVSLLAPSLESVPYRIQTVTIPANKTVAASWQVRPIDTIRWFNQRTLDNDYMMEQFRGDIEANQRWLILRSDSPLVGIEPLRYDCYIRFSNQSPEEMWIPSLVSGLIGIVLLVVSVRRSNISLLKKPSIGTAVFMIAIVLICACVVLTLLGPAIGNVFPADRSSYIY